MWATFILWPSWWPATPPNCCVGNRWRSSLCCQFERQLWVPPAGKPSLSSPQTVFSTFEGIVGWRTNPGQAIKWIPAAPCLQTLITFLVTYIHVGTFNFLEGQGDCDQMNLRWHGAAKIQELSIGVMKAILLVAFHVYPSFFDPPSTATQMSALLTNMVTCVDLCVFSAWIIAFSSTFF